jgi:hypothetical protein
LKFNEGSVKGEWWFPNSNIHFQGELIFSDNMYILTLFGSGESFTIVDRTINQSSTINTKLEESEKIILGKTTDKKDITLLYSLPLSSRTINRDHYIFVERIFRIDYIFFEIHFKNYNEIQFEYVLIEYSNFNDWIWDSDFNGRTLAYKHESEPKYILEYYFGKNKSIMIHDKVSIEFFSYPIIEINLIDKNKISYVKYIKITSKEDRTLQNYIKLKNIFQDFLNFIISNEIQTLKMIGYIRSEVHGHSLLRKTEILYISTISSNMNKVKVISPYLINYNIFAEKSREILINWFNLRNKLPAVYDIYFGIMYNTDLYLSNQFLMLAEATAIYTETIISNNPSKGLQDKIFRINTICNKLDDCCILNVDDREWIKKILQDKKSLSFKEKMSEICENYSDLLPSLSSTIGSKDEFSLKLTKYRNRLTHGNINYDDLDYQDLFWKCKDLQLILQLCILSEIGFTIKELKSIFQLV